MRRLVFHLAIACLTFLVGCFIAASYSFLMTSDESPRVEVEEIDGTYLVELAPQPKLRVHSEMHACGPTANFHSYTASDGAKLSVSCFHMASAKRVALEVKKRLAGAKEILERQVDRTEEDVVVRERIVLLNGTGVMALTVSGKSFCETTAPTLKHIQALETR